MLDKFTYLLLLLPFVLSAYDEKQAILHATYSMVSHCSNQQIQSWSCALCKTYPYLTQLSIIQDANTSIKGYVGYDKSANTIVVAWRGTDNNLWSIESMDYKQIDYQGSFRCGNCKINQGFWDIYYAVHKQTQDRVKVLADKHPNSRITITGHSLGAALATVGGRYQLMQLFSSTRITTQESLRSTCTDLRGWAIVLWQTISILSFRIYIEWFIIRTLYRIFLRRERNSWNTLIPLMRSFMTRQ